jgi:glycosyltransferase involved in cell wall biosynthesis
MIENNVNDIRKVLSICDISPSKLGSFEEFIIKLTLDLRLNGISHTIVFREYPTQIVSQKLKDAGASIEIMKPSKWSLFNLLPVCKLIKRTRPDIVHFHFYPIYSVLNYVKYLCNTKVILTDHMGGRNTENNIKKIIRRVYYYSSFLLFNNPIDKIICVSYFVQNKYNKEYGIKSNKFYVIYNGINTDKFMKKEMSSLKYKYGINDEYVVTCIGLRRDKGPNYLLNASPLILKKLSNVKFLYIGEGECKELLMKKTKEYGISDKVIFAGKVPDLCSIYNISSVVAVPSTFEEAFCFVAAEAMASEIPVVAFDSGAIKEVLYDSNCIISKNPEQLATKIVECLEVNYDGKVLRNHVLTNFLLNEKIKEHVELYFHL